MEIKTRWPRGGWGLEITVDNFGSSITYMVSSEEDAARMINQLDGLLDELMEFKESFDPK